MSLPTDAKDRKALPLARGLLDYFPDALAAVADVSRVGNEQHNPGQPIHWAKHLSTDHDDCILRHMVDRGKRDTDKLRHRAKTAWRALASLQMEIEAEQHGCSYEEYIERLKAAAEEPDAKRADCILAKGVEATKAMLRDTYGAGAFDVVCDQSTNYTRRWIPTGPPPQWTDNRIPCRCDNGCSYDHENFDHTSYYCRSEL